MLIVPGMDFVRSNLDSMISSILVSVAERKGKERKASELE